jgi:hypothetical protein
MGRNICPECREPVTSPDRRVLRHAACHDRLIRGQIDQSFCSCVDPRHDAGGQCDECWRPVYKALAETPQMRAAVEDKEWAGPWAWHER